MKFLSRALTLAIAIPGLAAAQRSQMPRGNTRPTIMRPAEPPELKTKDLENLNPARIALRQKDLGLTADQTHRLDSIALAFDAKAKSLETSLDTLQGIVTRGRRNAANDARDRATRRTPDRPSSAKDSIERARNDSIDLAKADRERERVMAARNGLEAILLSTRADYDAYLTAVRAVLDDAQRVKLEASLAGASEELTARLHWANSR